MGRGARAATWGGIALAGLALAELGVFHLAQTGSCVSGGPYEVRNPCPGGTWLWLGAVALGGVVCYVAVGLLATELSEEAGNRLVMTILSGGWILSGLVALAAVYSPGAHAGARTGGIIVCVVWIAIGVLWFLVGRGVVGKSRMTS